MATTDASISDQRTDLLRRWNEMDTEFSTWVDQGQQISRYLLPRSGRFFTTDRNIGTRKYNNILDSTATRALRILGAGLMGGATSPARPWFKLETDDPKLNAMMPVKLWLDQTTRLMLDIFQRSNVYRSLHNIYEELGAFGTAACLLLDDFQDVIRLYPMTYGEYRLATNDRKEVDTLARRFDMTVAQIVKEFGYDNCSTNVQSLYDRNIMGAWVTVFHFIEPRIDRDPTKKNAENMAWKSVYFEEGPNADKFLRVSGHNRFRVLAPRWMVSGGDIYGTGPGAEALGDIKQLQHEQLRKGEVIDYQTKPPTQSPASMKNREIDRLPGGNSFVDMTGATGGIKTLFEVNLRLDFLLSDIQDVRQRINAAFYTDLFLMIANDQRSGITATEIAELHEEKLLMLGPVLERLDNELLNPLISLTFEACIEANILPPPPEELQNVRLNVEYTSVLAQAQRAITTKSTDRFVLGLTAVAQFKPEVVDKFNQDAWADDYADSLGVNPKLINDEQMVGAIRQQRAEAQAKMQQAAMAESMAKTANTLGKTPTGGQPNALTDITSQFQGYT